ncbi:FliI/YscN family ATPase [Yoonia sp.]|uniref:FliI/YscN family ATPase n=1 Tax=Yoonia sp. TaxID=2212373 RepID=UPI0025E4DAE4|nr:FliI/YscN family ATPase [Yoonia sp.]
MLTSLPQLQDRMAQLPVRSHIGRVNNVTNAVLQAGMRGAHLGDVCEIDRAGMPPLLAEVAALSGSNVILTPFGATTGLQVGAQIRQSGRALTLRVGAGMLGRVVDAFGQPIDDRGPLNNLTEERAIKSAAPPAMSRPMICKPLISGLRVIDGPMTLGRGQRMAIFGQPGTGKSTLLSQIARHTDADVVVIGLVGERGREVREFIDRDLDEKARKHVVIVAATSDRVAIERSLCAHTATAVAEHFRDQGKSVLLMIDSLTRTARALREIGLSIGEPPTRRGYPASVYPALPAIIERSGRAEKGDITAIYTVLTEGDGQGDPIAEEVRSLTDGHIVLSRKLAESGHYPAIDVLDSLSRIMPAVTPDAHRQVAMQLRGLMAKYRDIELLLQIGEYKTGGDAEADKAIAAMPEIRKFLQQKEGNPQEFRQIQQLMRRVLA